jgi:hypothetical protein
VGIRCDGLIGQGFVESQVSLQQAVAADPRAEHHMLSGALSEEYVLHRPVAVHVWPEDTVFVAATDEIDVHAFGETVDEAIANLRLEIAEHVVRLEVAGERLSPRLKRERDNLRALVQRRDA